MQRLFPPYDGPPLLEQVCSVPTLTTAWQHVRRNIQVARRAHSAGTDAVTLRDFESDWIRQMATLADELRSGQYRPVPPRLVRIPKPHGGERVIAILAIRDRVAQRAMLQVLEPVFDPLLLDCSFGCRRRVGVPDALAQVARAADQGRGWVVDADIATYFDTIDHHLLLTMLRQRLDEVHILHLIAQWLEVGALTQEADAPGLAQPPTPLHQGGQMLRQLVAPPEPPAPPAATWDDNELTVSADWAAAPRLAGWEPGALARPGGLLDQRLWAALSLAQPALEGARALWPQVRRVGPRRLALAGAAVTGAILMNELVARVRATRRRGTLQGGALSPLLANIYLHPFDLALTSQGLRLVRFMDDFVILCFTQSEAEHALKLARQQLAVLRLQLNEQKTRVVTYTDGLEFLGQTLMPRRTEPRLGAGLTSFAEAEQALRSVGHRLRPRRRTTSPTAPQEGAEQ